MSPSAMAGAPTITARPNANAESAPRRETKQKTLINDLADDKDTSPPGSSSSDLRIEVDGLGFPLLIIRAILRRHRQRIAILDWREDALRLRFESRICRRVEVR